MLDQYDDVISVKELCEILKIGRNRAYELLQTNKIKGIQMGRPWKIPKVSVEQFLKSTSGLK
jgi:excisionase family DNA binding protein